jgi:hypothetical protein
MMHYLCNTSAASAPFTRIAVSVQDLRRACAPVSSRRFAAGLPCATGNRNHRAPPSAAELDGNRQVGIVGERAQRRGAIGA